MPRDVNIVMDQIRINVQLATMGISMMLAKIYARLHAQLELGKMAQQLMNVPHVLLIVERVMQELHLIA